MSGVGFSRAGVYTLLLCLLFACSGENPPTPLEKLRVSVLPDQTDAQLRSIHTPLLEYLQEETGLQFELAIPDSYHQLLQWFEEGQVELAFFGGVTFLKAHLSSGAIPLVMRDVDANFTSLALVQANNPATRLQDLAGKAITFGSPLSTSGHYMPRYFFRQQGIEPEEFFSKIEYSNAHDTTAYWVRDGTVDVGIANSKIIMAMLADGRLQRDEVKVIWSSPQYADYVWAIQPDIISRQRNAIRDAFLGMNQSEQGKQILEGLHASYFVPAGIEDFSRLQSILSQVDPEMDNP